MKKAGNIWLPDKDSFFTNKLDYELHDFKLAMTHPTNFRVAIDIGAHVGFWSCRLAEKFQTVLSFEPIPDHFECLQKNTENLLNNQIFNVALSNTEKQVFMSQAFENSGMSSVIDEETNLCIDAKTLDSFNLNDIDFIKIDVEGHEHEVLEGAKDTLNRCRPVLFIEVLNANTATSPVFSTLSSWGYTQAAKVQENYIFVNRG